MYFAIRRSDNGQYWWRAVGDNNEIMAASELMKTKQNCEHAISVMQAEARSMTVWAGPLYKRGRCRPRGGSRGTGSADLPPLPP